ncbi:MAG: hypothetical protein ACI8P3_003495 [Saprospiraceae bacterium]|jgi:hypothetical protein
MNQCTLFLVFCFVLGACSPAHQNAPESTKKSESPDSTLTVDSLPFPQSWLGYWEGELEIFKENKLVQTLPMALELLEMDTSKNFVWTIIYGEDKETGRRAYELETLDAEKGYFLMDEKNTIRLESYLFQNKLMSWYEVMGSQILSIQELQGDQMIFEIIFGSSEPVSITGDQQFDGEDIPAVKTFPIGGYQRAILKKAQ